MNEYANDMSPYRAAGELAGVTNLVDDFYANMETFPEARGETKGSGIFFVSVCAGNLSGPSGFLDA
jgi:hypothetical protein